LLLSTGKPAKLFSSFVEENNILKHAISFDTY
jgi:hypothetical protein